MLRHRFRLNQAIAKSGICSRRQADLLIAAGRVCLNGVVVVDFNATVDPGKDSVMVDGRRVEIKSFTYIALHKPKGVVTTTADEKGRRTVIDLLPRHLTHLRPVGRLDMYSEGLLLLTNDGRLTQRVTHPSHHLPKHYKVEVRGFVKPKDLRTLASGMVLDDGPTARAQVHPLRSGVASSSFEIVLTEGRSRQIRRMCALLGYRVIRLVRVAIGGLQLGQMQPGSWRPLTAAEVKEFVAGDY